MGICAALCLLGVARCAPSTVTVGTGTDQAHPGRAIAHAGYGDTILVNPGVYEQCAVIKASHVTIEGTGPGVVFSDATCQGKAIFVTVGSDITIRNLTLQRASVRDDNGAGIRAQGTNLLVDGVKFLDNQEGILTTNNKRSTIRIINSDFERNGLCAGNCAHGVYVGHINTLDIEHSHFFNQRTAHHVKSRAFRTILIDNVIEDGPKGTASYEVDVPNGGALLMQGNTLEKGPKAQNWATVVAIGEEKGPQQHGEIIIRDNKLTNDNKHTTVFVRNETKDPAQLIGNTLIGDVTPLEGPGSVK
ncbi:MAG: right-handed parallel beta-helix repeat-containing protein [Acetobacteraceae bacterium]